MCLLWIAVVLLLVFSDTANGREFSVLSFGAIPNDGVDDTRSVQAAVDAAIAAGPDHAVVFPPGMFNISATIELNNAVGLIMSGAGQDYYSGTLLVGLMTSSMFAVGNCNSSTITGFVVDYWPLPFVGGYIVDITDSYMDVKAVAPHTAEAGYQAGTILRYDPTIMRPARGPRTYELYQTPPPTKSSIISPNVVRIPVAQKSQFLVGDPVVARWNVGGHVITAQDSYDFTLRSVTLHAGWSMGFVTLRAHRLNIIDYHVMPWNGRWMSTNVDCMHLADNRQFINIINSSCSSQGDDCLNVHAFYFVVSQVIDSSTLMITEHSWPETLNVLSGTRMEFGTAAQPYTVYRTATVASVKNFNNGNATFTFTTPVTGVNVGDSICVADAPALTLYNFTGKHNRARGVLLETRNISITNSLFNATSGPAILFQPSAYWHEATHARNVTLKHNVYDSCNEGIAQQSGVIALLPDPVQTVPVLHEITVSHSTFYQGQYSRALIEVVNGGFINLTANYLSTSQPTPMIFLCNSHSVVASYNCIDNTTILSSYYTYEQASNVCEQSLSSVIDLPDSAFTSRFKPPVIPAPSGYGVIVTDNGDDSVIITDDGDNSVVWID